MSVSGSTCASSALGVLANTGSSQLQQKIASKVVMDQMESEAALVAKLVEPTNSTGVGSRVDFRA
jgi:hypothetical protein